MLNALRSQNNLLYLHHVQRETFPNVRNETGSIHIAPYQSGRNETGDLIMKEKDLVMVERLVDGKFTITSFRLFYGDECTTCNDTFERIDFDGHFEYYSVEGNAFYTLKDVFNYIMTKEC